MHLIPWMICAVTAIGAGEPVLVDYSASWCGPCREMEPVVARLEQEGFKVQRVDFDANREQAIQNRVEAIPTFILMIDGREVGRVVGKTSYEELRALYPARPAQAPAPERRSLLDRTLPSPNTAQHAAPQPASIPAATPSVMAQPAVTPVGMTPAPVTTPIPQTHAVASAPAAGAQHPAAGLRNLRKREGVARPASAAPAPKSNDPIANCFAASVRLKIDDAQGRSCGSGTVIDALDNEALVLTCGHIFRENKGQGTILVDFVGDTSLQGLPARVVGYDLKSDVGLVSVETPRRVASVRIAPTGYMVRQGDKVVSIGCPHGGEATVEPSKVNSLNKYLGPSNIQVAGLPIEGRSGGGLFSADGQLIGVCNAADPQDNEGLYAGLDSVHTALKASGLQNLIPAGAPLPNPATLAAAPSARRPAAPEPSRAAPVAPPVSPVANVPATNRAAAPSNLSADEQAVLSQIAQHGEHAEVVCVIRSLSDPRAKSEIIVLDRASPDFLRQLASEQNVQDARTLTQSNADAQPQTASPSRGARQNDSWTPVWKTPNAPTAGK